jgi:hypothetical protein
VDLWIVDDVAAADWGPTLLIADLERTARLALTDIVFQDVSADSTPS